MRRRRRWYRKAAEQGDSDGQDNLGEAARGGRSGEAGDDFRNRVGAGEKGGGNAVFRAGETAAAFLRAGEAPADLERNLERVEAWLAAIPLRERFIYAAPFVIEWERRN